MTTVEDLITDVLRREGWPKYTDRPADKGGPTRGGITLATLQRVRGQQCTWHDVANLTEAEARTIYRQEYVLRWKYDAIRDPALQALVVDWTVTSGPDDPVKALQAALGVAVDGAFGPVTRAALANAPESELPRLRAVLAVARVRQLVEEALDDRATQEFLREHPEVDLHNLRGWVNRAAGFVA